MARPSASGAGLDLAQLDRLVAAIPIDRFAAQRWFRAKRRRIADLRLDDAAPLVPDPQEAGLDAALAVVRVSYLDGGSDDRYLLPMVLIAAGTGDDGDQDQYLSVADPQSGALLREPRDGEGVWRRLAMAIAAGMALPSVHGTFACDATEALDALVPSAGDALRVLDERRLRVEQTNTSVVLGERLIYKAYRQLEPGLSPDLEVTEFLTSVGFVNTPALAGVIRYQPERGEACAAGMLQAFVQARGDAWAWMTDQLRRPDGPAAALDGVRRIGDITAALHAALASRSADAAFPARAATVAETAAWRAGAERMLAEAISSLGGTDHDRLVRLAPAVRARFADAFGSAAAHAPVSRIHGDYHLGQLLRVGGDFMVIDFEGEPARPLADRRAPHSPLKDVAGMIRSFDYAIRIVAADTPAAARNADEWLAQAGDAFADAYRSGGPGVPLDPGLLAAFELEKACYEVRYEANNRPDWLWLPLAAIEQLVA